MFDSSKQPKSINFLEPVYSPDDIWSSAYLWLVTAGKALLVIVELLVLGVFISRFFLDKINNDLSEDINAQVTMLSTDVWQKNASLYSNYQILFTDVRKVREGQDLVSTEVSTLLEGVPSTLTIDTFSMSDNKVSFYITSTSLDSVKDYETALKNNPNYSNVKFTIEKEGANLDVRVTFDLNVGE